MKIQTNRIAASALACALALGFAGNAAAQKKAEFASKDEAVAMVKKGVAYIKANGKEKGYAEITNKKGQFTDRDLYLVVYGLDGVVHAHGANEKMVEQEPDRPEGRGRQALRQGAGRSGEEQGGPSGRTTSSPIR